jgi:hypothetical protein
MGALAWAAALGVLVYAPILPQVLRTLLGPSPFAADTTWQSPLWLIAETARGLGQGLPGGWVSLALGGGVALLGLQRLWREDPVLVWLVTLPAVLTGATVVAMGHNLWPRFFFFSAGFAVLVAVRGGFETASLLLGGRGRVVARWAAVAVLAVSAATVPRAWGPKQDYVGAASFVDQARGAGDAVAVVDMTDYPYTQYLKRDWHVLTDAGSLSALEATHARIWVLYTFPIRLAAVQPGVWQRLEAAYDTAAVFPGTVCGGTVVVMVHPPENRGTP